MPTLEQQIRNMDSTQRRQFKTDLIQTAVNKLMPLDFVYNGLDIHVEKAEVSGDRLIVWASTPELPLEAHTFINIPVMIPDGTFHNNTGPMGESFQAPNYTFNPLEAFKQVLADTLLTIKQQRNA